MLTGEIIGLSVIVLIAVLLVIFRKTPFVEKYWTYFLILAPAAIILLVLLFKKKTNPQQDQAIASEMHQAVEKIKDSLTEANLIAAIKTSAGKEKQAAVVKRLEEIKQIDDQKVRLEQLAAMEG